MLELSYARLKKILMILVVAQKEISSSYLSLKLKVSERTIRTDINRLNEDITKYNVLIKHHRSKGYFLKEEQTGSLAKLKADLEELDKKVLFDSVNIRLKKLMCLLLLTNVPISIYKILEDMYISSGTLASYIEEIKSAIKGYHLEIARVNNAFSIVGDEVEKRQCFIDQVEDKNYKTYILGFTDLEKSIFKEINLDELKSVLDEFMDKLVFDIADFNRKNIIMHIAITILRIKNGNEIITFSDNSIIKGGIEKEFNQLFVGIEQQFNVQISSAERNYIKYHFALNNPQIIRDTEDNSEVEINKAIMLFLDRIRNNYGFDLSDATELINNLRAHITSLIKINRFDSTRKNPLLDVIISTFPLAYEMTKTSIDVLEKRLNLTFNDDEVSFITLHIGAAMENRYNQRLSAKKVAIVCGSGTATANLLKVKLEAKFSQYIEIVGLYSFEEYRKGKMEPVDFIISTVPIFDSKIPVVQVDLANFAHDSKELSNFITTTENQPLSKLFDQNLIFIHQDLKSKDAVLRKMLSALEKENVTKPEYKHFLMKREKMYSTAIGGGIAIPHPIKFSAYKSRVAFLQTEREINWGNEHNVDLIFMLAINEDDYPKIQPLFSFLVDLQENSKFLKLIKKTNSAQEALQIINSFVKESLD